MSGQDTFSVPVRVLGPSSTAVHGGRHDTKYMIFEWLLHAAFGTEKNIGAIGFNQLVLRQS